MTRNPDAFVYNDNFQPLVIVPTIPLRKIIGSANLGRTRVFRGVPAKLYPNLANPLVAEPPCHNAQASAETLRIEAPRVRIDRHELNEVLSPTHVKRFDLAVNLNLFVDKRPIDSTTPQIGVDIACERPPKRNPIGARSQPRHRKIQRTNTKWGRELEISEIEFDQRVSLIWHPVQEGIKNLCGI
ncbi:MAG: hypothetical protein ACP5O6_02535 [Candidatus Baltobacteraceae bacterium]